MRRIFMCFAAILSFAICTTQFSRIKEYTKHDLRAQEPILLFIYYDGEDKGKCMACESYKPWLSSLQGKIGAFSIRRLNFNKDPLLVLRFRTTHFPTFFLQNGKHFKNITEADFFDLGIKYHKQGYINDIDAILRNPSVFDKIKTISSWKSPFSSISLAYAYGLSYLMMISYMVDQVNTMFPTWMVLLGFFAILFIAGSLKKRVERKRNSSIDVPYEETDKYKEKYE
ncbi:hypothetical protein NEFER03_0564 [Nematocida sp. LUAm3]|nr:hypothetical protein NEFER03_0564 [Nematocida sp. LUAm3]KAI5175531.1 hypothetical protein NEFER02_1437 [Nematocida sp. LUAm2]KAI5178439.1 hypothetical protein NEFER01_1586 [Nematocida sp. LUAm1]